MSEPPHTSREHAYVSISGPGTHEVITKRLGIEPTEAGNVGDVNPRTGQPRKWMAWKLHSGLDDTHPLAEHISSLLLIIGLKAPALRELWVDYDITLQCVGYYPTSQGPGAHFDREVVRQAAQLGLAIDCDFYFVDCECDG